MQQYLIVIYLESNTNFFPCNCAFLSTHPASVTQYTHLVIIIYYSTFVCPTEIIAFSDRVEEFRKSNTEVVAVSVDSQFTHLAWYVVFYTPSAPLSPRNVKL